MKMDQSVPNALQPIGLIGPVRRCGLEFGIEMRLEVALDLVGLLSRHHAIPDQRLAENLPGRRMLGDGLVHDRLGEHGFVTLVVPMAPIAENIDDHVPLELLTELYRQVGDPAHGDGVIAVDVEDGRLEPLGDIRRIRGRTRRVGVGGEADLIVDDDVDGAAGAVTAELRHIEGFGDNPLSGECRVTVQQQTHHLLARLVVTDGLLGAHLADNHRIDALQMRRIGGQ